MAYFCFTKFAAMQKSCDGFYLQIPWILQSPWTQGDKNPLNFDMEIIIFLHTHLIRRMTGVYLGTYLYGLRSLS